MNFILDTNVICELTKTKPNSQVIHWINSIDETRLFLSVITLGEIQKGIKKISNNEIKSRKLAHWYSQLKLRFKGRIITFDMAISEHWGSLSAALPSTVPAIDTLIAATASYHHCSLATRNTKDFSQFNITLLNPWNDH
jgi:predicted nucleic acid-binding protein